MVEVQRAEGSNIPIQWQAIRDVRSVCQHLSPLRSMLNWRQVGQYERYFYNMVFSLVYEMTRIKAEVQKAKFLELLAVESIISPIYCSFSVFTLPLPLFLHNQQTNFWQHQYPFILLNSCLSSSGHSTFFIHWGTNKAEIKKKKWF